MTGTRASATHAARRAFAIAAGAAVAAAGVLSGCGGGAEPANGLIAFARAPAGGGGQSQIYVVHPQGTFRPLTEGALDRSPAWSPDGRRVAFLRSVGGGPQSAEVVDLEGAVRSLGPAEEVAWSPDGGRLLLADDGAIDVVDADGGARESVVAGAGAVQDAAWSPDGGEILFVGGDGGLHADLYTAEPGRAGTVRLTRLPFEAGRPYSPAWSPDGKRIAYLLPGGVFVMSADGSGATALVRVPESVYPSSLAWSPDGETLAYTLLRLRGAGGGGSSGVFLVSPGGGEPRQLTEEIDVNVAWSPDGRRLTAQRFTGFHISQILELDVETGAGRLLTDSGHSDTSPAWQRRP